MQIFCILYFSDYHLIQDVQRKKNCIKYYLTERNAFDLTLYRQHVESARDSNSCLII